MERKKTEYFKVKHKNKILTISLDEFLDICAETMTKFDELELAELVEKSLELAVFGALLTYNLFDGD